MSFFDCVDDAWNDLDREKAARLQQWKDYAQKTWQQQADTYEQQGHPRHVAEALAGEDAKAAFKKLAGRERHTFLARAANNRKQALEVQRATDLRRQQTDRVEVLDYEARALTRRFNAMVLGYLDQHHRNVWQSVKDPLRLDMMVREILGEPTGDAQAAALAQAVSKALDEMRLMANENGASIGKLDRYFPQKHNRMSIMNAGIAAVARENGWNKTRARAWAARNRDAMFQKSFDEWFKDIGPRIDWTRIEDNLTGRPFQPEGSPPPSIDIQRRFMKEVFDGIAYGPQAKSPKYGGAQGEALYSRMSRERVLHFKSADDWMAYNKRFGSADPHHTLMAHVHGMARDIAAMRAFGPNPQMGLQYRADLAKAEAMKRGVDPATLEGRINHAQRMFNVQNGGSQGGGYLATLSANFFSDVRHVQTAAFLDRAIVSSLSDLNFSKMAAQAIGADRSDAFSRYVKGVSDMVKEGTLTTDEMKQWMWISDTVADPGAAAARFNGEAAGSSWAEKLSSGVMRISGLSSHTDQGRFSLYQVFSGQMANQVGKRFEDIEPGMLAIFKDHGITARDWELFTQDGMMTAPNGAKFLNPQYWRNATALDDAVADDLYIKFGAAIEDFIEIGVPTQSLYMRGFIDPAAYSMTPGTPQYEVLKSGGMFKSFVMAMTFNMHRAMRRMPGNSKYLWLAESVAGATIMGAVSLQLLALSKGQDPLAMNDPMFWGQALAKGGGLAIVGDIVVTGETKWGGGFGSYIAGPMPQTVGDAWNLTVGNLVEVGKAVLAGEELDTKFPEEIRRAVARYTPGGDLPMLGPAYQRMIVDQLYRAIDPEAEDTLLKSEQRRQNRDGNASWWMPGSPMPERAPDLTSAIR
jgi:hypothetical protein